MPLSPSNSPEPEPEAEDTTTLSRAEQVARGVARPLDLLGSIKMKIGVLVTAAVVATAGMTWVGLRNEMGPSRTLPLAILAGLVVTQILAHGMTSPLREMTEAAQAMAKGDYSKRVTITSRDEVGQLARAFTVMAEDLAQADMLRREMIANVSHELRTPVAALQAELENMVDGVTTPDAETLEVLLTQTRRLGRLVTDMLDLSRLDADVVTLTIEEVEAQAFIDEAVQAAKLVASSAGKRVAFVTDVTPPNLALSIDVERMHQVMANLLSNAIRATPDHSLITIRVQAQGRWVQIDVGDQGPGIPLEERQHVFERFARGKTAQPAGSQSTGGTGLGLAIARWAVLLHAGSIEVADAEEGCVMRVRLPKSPKERERDKDKDKDRDAKAS
ncbi:MAG: HAMP domain-containing histidine kinase [Bifidobacteriaceae bacterium]|jgi:signal transduction histidine kinase|nr:HAMP domain-containing histidine kinase [Bifidobacteriaceae bacterium]